MADVAKTPIVANPQQNKVGADVMMQRLINIELKLNVLLREQVPLSSPAMDNFTDPRDQVYGPRTYAQHGDDMVFLIIFDMIGIARPSYLDIGANDPVNNSNTALLYLRGSRGINVEANPKFNQAFKTQRPEDINLNVGVAGKPGTMTLHIFGERSGMNTFDAERARQLEQTGRFKIHRTIEVPIITVSEILDKYSPDKFPDLLSVDVEGLDLDVLRSIDYARSAPKVICVEGNSPEERQGLIAFAESKGYVLYFRVGANLIFLQAQFLPALRT